MCASWERIQALYIYMWDMLPKGSARYGTFLDPSPVSSVVGRSTSTHIQFSIDMILQYRLTRRVGSSLFTIQYILLDQAFEQTTIPGKYPLPRLEQSPPRISTPRSQWRQNCGLVWPTFVHYKQFPRVMGFLRYHFVLHQKKKHTYTSIRWVFCTIRHPQLATTPFHNLLTIIRFQQ